MHRANRVVAQLSPAPVAEKKARLISDEQLKQYKELGYIVVKGVVPESDLAVYTKRFQDISDGKVTKPSNMLMMRDVAIAKQKQMGEGAITKLQNLQDEKVLWQYCKHPNILAYMTELLGPNVKAVHTMLINKPPDAGLGSSRHPPHQDLWYFPFRPAERIVCAWTAMQKIDKENGCLFVKPGSHTGELLKHEYPNDGIVNKAYHGIQNMSSEEFGKKLLHLEMEPGDCVFFHPLLIHGSGRNNSGRFRKAISCHYANSNCFYESIEGTIQEDVAKELEQMAAKKGAEISFYDIWKYRGRLVAGKDNTL